MSTVACIINFLVRRPTTVAGLSHSDPPTFVELSCQDVPIIEVGLPWRNFLSLGFGSKVSEGNTLRLIFGDAA